MKFNVHQSILNQAIALVSRAVPVRPAQPILANIKLDADVEKQQVELTAFDLALGIKTCIDAQVFFGGSIGLPAKLLSDIISRLPSGEIGFELKENSVTLTALSGSYKITGMESNEFPEFPSVNSQEPILLSSQNFLQGTKGTLFCASSDETKQVLTGVHILSTPDFLEFAATDGHRLSVVKTGKGSGEFSATIPVRAMQDLEKLISTEDEVSILFDGTVVRFSIGSSILTSRVLDGEYPVYNQLIPKQFKRQISLNKKGFQCALERVAVVASMKNQIVKMAIDANAQNVTLSAESSEVGSGQETLVAQIEGDSLDIAFNIKYLLEAIKNIPGGEVEVMLNEALTPVILCPLGGLEMKSLIMPVQLRN